MASQNNLAQDSGLHNPARFVINTMKTLIQLLLLFTLASCKIIIGVREPKLLDDKALRTNATKLHVPNGEVQRIDTTKYRALLRTLGDSALEKDFLQPLQIYFYQQDQMLSHLVNCHVGGFPRLNWKRSGSFDTYPFLTGDLQNSLAPDITLQKLLACTSATPSENNMKSTMIIFYSNILYRNAKTLIDAALQYRQK
ncbi:MAG: hypothetical protein RL660_1528 [Bacteroidota bacterium]